MSKKTTQSANGTSFHSATINASVNQLINTFSEPTNQYNTGEDKVNFEWVLETDEGDVFTLYDWKEGRPLSSDETIEWHIGTHSKDVAWEVKEEVEMELNGIWK